MIPAPIVSVLIPAYNSARYIGDAVGSVSRQTLQNLEIILVDDGSSDDTVSRAEAVGDQRLRVIRHAANQGIPAARNTALAAARGRYIAWLDSDDMARPSRLAVQIEWLERNPDIAMVGCCAGKLTENGARKLGVRVPPFSPADVHAWLLFRSAFQQSAVTGRSQVLKETAYTTDNAVCEDLDVFIRLSDRHKLANLPRVLIDRRLHSAQTVRTQRSAINARKRVLLSSRLRRMGMDFDAAELDRHLALGSAKVIDRDTEFLGWVSDWLDRLESANHVSRVFDPTSLRFVNALFASRAIFSARKDVGWTRALAYYANPRAFQFLAGNGRAWLKQSAPVWLAAR